MKQIPMLNLRLEYEYMKEDIDAAIQRCLEHQKWIFGPEIKELEDNIADYVGVKHCIGVSSGTDALVLSLRALAIKLKKKEYWDRDDLIITTPFTFTATGDAILRAGATPLFVDIDPQTYNIDPSQIRDCLASSSTLASRVVGVVPVHLYGQSCQMDEIMSIAKEYNLFVLEDVAQAFGGMWKSKKLGSIGTAGAFSFFPSKNLGCFGDAGMVSTNNDEIAEIVRMLLKHGGKDKYNVDHIGYNARLDTLQAAILLAKLKYVDEFNEKRRKIAELYNEGLKGLKGLALPIPSALRAVNHVCHQYTIRVYEQDVLNKPNNYRKPEKLNRRDKLQVFLKDKGINTMVYYPFNLHKMKVFLKGRSKVSGKLKNAEIATQRVLSLPIEPLQSWEDTASVTDCVRSFFENKP